jgi:hypothetical protein
MVNCLEDASIVCTAIKQQQRKLREEMNSIVSQKATQSRYPSMSRADKRITEFHHDRLTQEQALQKDCAKAERIANRIAQVIERLRKDINKVKNHLGSYTFANTVGQDSEASGDSTKDNTAALATREAWKGELEKMLAMVMHYSNSQHLGDYALSYQPEGGRQVYRPEFYYNTPVGDCLVLDAGLHSGDSTAVQGGNYNDVETRECVVSYKPLSAMNVQETKNRGAPPKTLKVTNTDHELRALFRLLVATDAGHRDAWWSFLVGNSVVWWNSMTATEQSAAVVTGVSGLVTHFADVVDLPAGMHDLLSALVTPEDTDTDASGVVTQPPSYESVYQILFELLANPSGSTLSNQLDGATRIRPPSKIDDDLTLPVLNTGTGLYDAHVSGVPTADDSGLFDMALANAPTIGNVEDEADLAFIMKRMCCVMENLRADQIRNDRELSIIDFTNEVAECNEAFHQDAFADMTGINESELGQRYKVGKELCGDLDALYRDNCFSKQNFFNDVTIRGGL